MTRGAAPALTLLAAVLCSAAAASRYLGREVGRLSELHHAVRGRVYAVDARTLYVHDLHYDGEGPAAYFYVGSGKAPGAGGTRLRDERGGAGPLRRYRGEGVTLSLPEGMTFKDIKWFSIWCDEFAVNFGDVRIPRELEYPRPARLGALRGVHGVSSDNVVVVDAQTLLVPNFSYDGEAPDAKFWVGRGDTPSPQGVRIPDENGKEAPLRKYDRKTIVLTLPGELTVFDIGHFGVWCEAFTVNFGHVPLPRAKLHNVPPSLKMLGVSPQSKLNCEVLQDELAFEVRWAVAGDSIVLQLVAKLEDGEYMSFGLSGDDKSSQMVGGDVAVAWLDKATLKGHAVDYYLDAKSQCAGVRGSCPDERLGEKTNSIRLLNAALVNGYSIVTYQRGLRAADQLDRAVRTNASQPVLWAVGPLNSRNEVSYHSHFLKGDKFIEFGRPPVWNCPMPETEEDQKDDESAPPAPALAAATATAPLPRPEKQELSTSVIKPNTVPTPKPVARAEPWEIPGIQCHEPADGVLYAQMGPTGGRQGYSAITGHVGWGISWYINGLLIPEINVVRGKKYTFVVEGGTDATVPARYHPFYITNDPVGGYFHKSEEEKQGVEIYAGVRRTRSGELVPVGVGRLCNWTPDAQGPEADEYPSFGAYQRSLTLVCEEGHPGVVTWVPDKSTPDTVYYQCFTHRHLGWKINVLDECDVEPEASQLVERLVAPPPPQEQDLLTGEESIQVASRVKPDSNFLTDHSKKVEKIINTKHNYNDFSNDYLEEDSAGARRRPPPANQSEHELPISKAQIKEVIQAAEVLESQAQEEFRRNATKNNGPFPDNVRDMFLPEQPVDEHDELVVEPGAAPSSLMLPPPGAGTGAGRPLTLQTVLRPHAPGRPRPPFRRPAPPEIKLRRPAYQNKGPNGYPLSMPNHHGPHPGQMSNVKKPYGKHPNPHHPSNMGNLNQNMNRPPMPAIPPMKAMPSHGPSPVYNPAPARQGPKIPAGVVQSIIMGKPSGIFPPHSQTLSLGKSDIIANQIVKSQITLPGTNDAITQHTVPQISIVPGQIILGKPMENPVPLDQQMIPTKHHSVIKAPATQQPEYQYPTTHRVKSDNDKQSGIKPSDFMEQSADKSTIAPAINTGFKPDSIVIESGFKPIIREPLMASEDRITDFDSNPNRREDIDMEDEYVEAPQVINSNHAYSQPSDKITESFEPMFIPSPEDHMLPTYDRTKEVFPKNHAKEDRPHPVYIKSESDLDGLFSKKNMEKDVPSDLAMEADRVSSQYLPPDMRLTKQQLQKILAEPTFTSYDGKTVSAVSLTSVPDISEANTKLFSKLTPHSLPADLLLNMPQSGPYRGEISDEVRRQLSGNPTKDAPINRFPDDKTTHLKLVNSFTGNKSQEDLKASGSEVVEVTEEKEDSDKQKEEYVEDEEYEDEEEEEEEESKRRHKRETQATQFEPTHTEQTSTQRESLTQNQVEFEHHSGASSRALHCPLPLSSLLLFLCMNLI